MTGEHDGALVTTELQVSHAISGTARTGTGTG